MINLLPTEVKDEIVFARRNNSLRNWVVVCLIALAGVILIVAAGHLFIYQSTRTWQSQVNDTRAQLGEQKLEDTQKKITDISDSIKLALQVLSREILFSKLISQIGNTIPDGSSLQGLTINTAQSGVDITAVATDYQTATQVHINLSDPKNQIFEKADILNVTCTQAPDEKYPCNISIRALFADKNEFQYVNQGVKNE